ncbi:MAG: hypothetical protein JEY96_11740 [Bacteroidales bacterium]|nr:hypothetical protein [Bacteroidales bacterium]
MPDVYNRIQTGTKASTLGTFLSLFVLITNPVSSHVVARASHCIKVHFFTKNGVNQYEKDAEIFLKKN